MLDTQVYRGADFDSDHRLVIASFRLKLAKKVKCRKGKVFDVQCLKQPDRRVEYMEEIEKRFSDRMEKESAETVWKELKEAVVDVQRSTYGEGDNRRDSGFQQTNWCW